MAGQIFFAFLVGGLICAVFEVIGELTGIKVPHFLLIGVLLGGIFGACGIAQALMNCGGAGFGVMVIGFGNGVFQAFIEAFSGNGLPLLLVLVEVVALTAIGIIAAIIHGKITKG